MKISDICGSAVATVSAFAAPFKPRAIVGVVLASATTLAAPVFAVSAFDPLTAAVTFTDVIAAVMAVSAIIAGLYVTMRGVRTILGFIRR